MDRKVTGFYHENDENGYLSCWYPCRFKVNGVTYNSAEQYLVQQKALLLGIFWIAGDVMKESDPEKIRKMGRPDYLGLTVLTGRVRARESCGPDSGLSFCR